MKSAENVFPNAKIRMIDDNPENVKLVARLLEWAGYDDVVMYSNSATGLAATKTTVPDILLLDLHMPAPDGYEILNVLRADPRCSGLPILVFSADATAEAKSRALDAGASDFLTKPGDTQEILLRVRNFLKVRKLHLDLSSNSAELEERVHHRTLELATARQEAMEALARAAEFRDKNTGIHTQRVGELSARIALEHGMPQDFVEALRLAAPLHDVGKVGLSDAILLKSGELSTEERAAMQAHTLMGEQIFAQAESPLMILARDIALYHHERWDGSGYPHGLAGEMIPIAARIVAVADVYDALTSERTYKPAWSHQAAMTEILSQRGKHFDPKLVDTFARCIIKPAKQAA